MITNRDVHNLLSFIPNIIGKAYVTHIFSSGMTKKETLNLRISDLIESCDSAFGFTEERALENLLAKKPDDIVPMWKINKKDKIKITFSSSESLFYLFIYLTERLVKNGSIMPDEKLFVTGNSVLSGKEVNDIFKHSEKRYINYIGYSLKYHDLKTFNFNKYHYSTKDLRNNFKIVSEKVLLNSIDDEKEQKKLYNLFTVGLSENDKYFQIFSNDTSKLREIYLTILPYLSAKNYEKKYPDYFEEEKNLFEDIPIKINHEINYSDELLNQILKDYVKFIWEFDDLNEYNDGDDLFDIFKELAVFDRNNGNFKESKEYLDNLMKNALIKSEVLGIDFDFSYENTIDDVANYIGELGIFDKFNIKREGFMLCMEDYFSVLDRNKMERKLSKSDLADLLIESR